jgi:hypothetical protein
LGIWAIARRNTIEMVERVRDLAPPELGVEGSATSQVSGGLPNAPIGVPASPRGSHARSSSRPSTSATRSG